MARRTEGECVLKAAGEKCEDWLYPIGPSCLPEAMATPLTVFPAPRRALRLH